MALNPLLSLRLAYNSDLPRILPGLSLSISDSIMTINVDALANSHISIHQVEKLDHPVFYGVNHTITDFLKSPLFAYLGKNTHVLATFKDLKKRDSDEDVNKNTKRAVVGRASWVNSTFGNGKIILYSSHPDFVNNITPLFKDREWEGDPFYGRRIIHNSIFYVTSEENVDLSTDIGYSLSFIDSIIVKTEDLAFLQQLFLPLENKSIIFSEGYRFLKYAFWFCEIYQDYINRSLENIDKLEQIIPMISGFDVSIADKVIDLKNDLNQRLNESEVILIRAANIAEKLEEILTSSKISIVDQIQLIKNRRTLLETFETGLKYIPQTYFETLKLVRHSWYNYEANIAITA